MLRILLPVCLFLGFAARSQMNQVRVSKLSPLLLQLNAARQQDSIMVSISLRNNTNQPSTKNFLSSQNHRLLVQKIAVHDLDSLAQQEAVLFINEVHIPKEELTTGAYDLTLNKINYVHERFPGLNGDSLQAIIKERFLDTADIDLKNRIFRTGMEANFVTSHASLMATMIAGAANTSPFAKGCADAASVGSTDFLNLLPDTDSLFQQKKVSLQNHSYGTVVENMYGNEAAAYDVQANTIPVMVHVFSAGNSGAAIPANGTYANVPGYANLTGNFKQAKNIITVGHLDSAGQLMPLSSKGPAYDGRVKPELMAYGEDGSSGAAATVSGAVLLAQHAYKKLKSQLPSSSLVKSVLINSATDVGIKNVDYASGYGNLDVFGAITTINENRIIEASVTQGEVKSFNLVVPAGISRLKLTLVWTDPAALPGSNKALVNDLDLQLKHPSSSSTWLPWVLDPSPNTTALQSPAQRKVDTLNVVEQITVDNPVAGNYSVELKGSSVVSAVQPFSIAYQMDTANQFYWTFPSAGQPLIANRSHWLRWSTNIPGQGEIDFATNGNNWRSVGTVSDLSSGYFKWSLPDTVTTALLRMKIFSTNTISLTDSFTISPPLDLQTGFNCPDSFQLYWNSIATGQYRLYELRTKYLEPAFQQADTAVILNKAQYEPRFYAVAPIIHGKEGFRSFSINYTTQGVDCYVRTFYLQSQTPTSALFHAEIGSLYNVQEVSLEKQTASGFITIQTIHSPTSLQFLFSDSVLTQGENWYRFKVKLKNGMEFYSNLEVVYHLPANPVVVYPNPVQQNQPLNILIKESGRFTMEIFDSKGRLLFHQDLNNTVTTVNAGVFGKGVYILNITDRSGKPFRQKLVVY